jgi:hypothetical protein
MKLPQRLLQLGTLAFFSSMIGSLVLYRSGFFEATPTLPSWLSLIEQDSLQPPWFDSVQFKHVLRETTQERLSSDLRMFGSKSAPPAPPPPRKKGKGEKQSTALAELRLDNATAQDSLIALDILRTRYLVAHLSDQEIADFQKVYAVFRGDKQRVEDYLSLNSGVYFRGRDSSLALERLMYGPKNLPRLSEQEKARFIVVLDSLTRPRMMSSKSGRIFISPVDTTQAIKIVMSEKHLK